MKFYDLNKNQEDNNKMKRIGIYKIEQVLSYVVSNTTYLKLKKQKFKKENQLSPIQEKELESWVKKTEKDYDGHSVKMCSQRYHVFKKDNCVCVKCGLKGKYFALEQHGENQTNLDRFHFNLYGEKDGKEVLFTKDHIIPRSKGGKNKLDNYQTMCLECNQEKGDKLECPRCKTPNSFIKLKMDSFIPTDKEKIDGFYCEQCRYFKYEDGYTERIYKSMNLDMMCPKCKSDLKEVNIAIKGTKQKIKAYQCPKCDYFAFNTRSTKKIINDLKQD